ncbi:hypothetical protein TNCV_4987921 [Trichonephila clavipes]|nr:hypothetical protein TNCV_4987921 [Trichonephila clavipes]
MSIIGQQKGYDPENSTQTLHSEISPWEYIKNAHRTVPILSTVYKTQSMTYQGKMHCTEHINSCFQILIKTDVQSVCLAYRSRLEHGVEWMTARVVGAQCPQKCKQHEDERLSPFVYSPCLYTQFLEITP